MRVDAGLSFPENLQPDNATRPGSSTPQNRSAPVSSGQDNAQLSVGNQTIQNAQSALSQVPEIRQERVNALRQAISSGQYQVSDQQLSTAMSADLAGQLRLI